MYCKIAVLVLLEPTKVFDTVDHCILVIKLKPLYDFSTGKANGLSANSLKSTSLLIHKETINNVHIHVHTEKIEVVHIARNLGVSILT